MVKRILRNGMVVDVKHEGDSWVVKYKNVTIVDPDLKSALKDIKILAKAFADDDLLWK